jgi:hypothetical protein
MGEEKEYKIMRTWVDGGSGSIMCEYRGKDNEEIFKNYVSSDGEIINEI